MASPKLYAAIFWAFWIVVFSKVGWYDLRVYMHPDARRAFVTLSFAIWIVALGLVCLPIAIPLLRQFNRVIVFWIAAVSPYLVLGLVESRANTFLLGDAARYALPVGFLLLGYSAARNVAPRTMLIAIVTTLAGWIAIRTPVHLAIGENIRFGLQWEVLLPCLLISYTFVVGGWRYALFVAALAAIALAFVIGQSRSILLGMAGGAAAIGLFALFGLRRSFLPNFRMGVAAALAIVFAIAPMLFPSQITRRLNLEAAVETSQWGPLFDASPVPYTLERPDELPAVARARAKLELAIADGGLSGNVRIAESMLFLEMARQTWKSLLLGSGAGDFVTIATPFSPMPRIVRGAHNTYVTLIYRHGIIIGPILIVFLAFYGLRANILQAVSGPTHLRILMTGVVAYRVAVLGMALLHQGLFDDPIVFFGIAMAAMPPSGQSRVESSLT